MCKTSEVQCQSCSEDIAVATDSRSQSLHEYTGASKKALLTVGRPAQATASMNQDRSRTVC
jgi:hypothetical protein